jgi:hypothetical protein
MRLSSGEQSTNRLTSSPPQTARIPTESEAPICSAGSSHNRPTSAEDNEEASLLAYPAISLVDKRSIEQWEEKKRDGPYIPGLHAEALRPLW